MNVLPFGLPLSVRLLAVVLGLWGCGSEGEPERPATCQGMCGYSIGCDSDPEPGCVAGCEELRGACPRPMAALLQCAVGLQESELYCDADGFTSPRESQCVDERAAVTECLQ